MAICYLAHGECGGQIKENYSYRVLAAYYLTKPFERTPDYHASRSDLRETARFAITLHNLKAMNIKTPRLQLYTRHDLTSLDLVIDPVLASN